ncbi:putative methyltransferase domain-containing protein [Ditylenchus destructor]|uniref:Ribosomal RNA-processing protein 8 n=1 Tax=Ditylenchus destructor TaxID=166010 RepID=A0AAD4NJK3_9BILA|nr:putative methyltransferase domain-containing protein [Ditylenchus destructor]
MDEKAGIVITSNSEASVVKAKKRRPWRQKVRNAAKKARLAQERSMAENNGDEKSEQNKSDIDEQETNVTNEKSKKERQIITPEQRLTTSRFRFLNELLYTSNSKDTVKMFEDDQEAFDVYHKGYQLQVKKWPIDPVRKLIMDLCALPESSVVADVGCGDAKIAQALGKKFTIHSFDLVARNEYITVADMAALPLEKGSVDVAVYCLSLMGTNLSDFFKEANRILKIGGKLKIVEVSSRFRSVARFVIAVQKMGFNLKRKKLLSDFFLFMTFEKIGKVELKRPHGLILKPCLYKKR